MRASILTFGLEFLSGELACFDPRADEAAGPPGVHGGFVQREPPLIRQAGIDKGATWYV
jgi:hypothetical protein